MFCLQCIWVPEMCPESRCIDYPSPRSPADSLAMAGPIRHCLLGPVPKCRPRPTRLKNDAVTRSGTSSVKAAATVTVTVGVDSNVEPDSLDNVPAVPVREELDDAIHIIEEARKAVRQIKCNKASGGDGIPAEV